MVLPFGMHTFAVYRCVGRENSPTAIGGIAVKCAPNAESRHLLKLLYTRETFFHAPRNENGLIFVSNRLPVLKV